MRITLPPHPALRAACLLAFVLVLVQLFWLAEPPLVRELKNLLWDKILHATAFGSFAMLLWVGLGFRSPILNVVLVTMVGAVDEFHQLFIPTRSADILDVLADFTGAVIVTFILHRLSRPAPGEEPRTGDRPRFLGLAKP